MADRDVAAEGRSKFKEAKKGKNQKQDTHKDRQGTRMKYQTPRIGNWDGREGRDGATMEVSHGGLESTQAPAGNWGSGCICGTKE